MQHQPRRFKQTQTRERLADEAKRLGCGLSCLGLGTDYLLALDFLVRSGFLFALPRLERQCTKRVSARMNPMNTFNPARDAMNDDRASVVLIVEDDCLLRLSPSSLVEDAGEFK